MASWEAGLCGVEVVVTRASLDSGLRGPHLPLPAPPPPPPPPPAPPPPPPLQGGTAGKVDRDTTPRPEKNKHIYKKKNKSTNYNTTEIDRIVVD